jgi:hypothetical protein
MSFMDLFQNSSNISYCVSNVVMPNKCVQTVLTGMHLVNIPPEDTLGRGVPGTNAPYSSSYQ